MTPSCQNQLVGYWENWGLNKDPAHFKG